jgi:molybdopterin molybdotransferase
MAGLLTIEDALARILAHARLLPEETVAASDATGRVLRQPAVATVDLPPFASSAMDGFAVRAADAPGELPVAFRVAAGGPASAPLPAGAAAGISTGGAVPAEADSVVPVEEVEDRGGTVVITGTVETGQHVRPRGGDVLRGATVVDAGARIRAAQIGSLAAAGVAELVCSAQPRVALIATGSELRAPGVELAPGQIYESNRAMLAAVLERAGARIEMLPVVDDDPDAHREAIARGLAADVLVSSGGVSMGEHDLVRQVEAELGVEEVFWGVAVKPGKPLSFGVQGETLVFGLPGNPVSSLVGALIFVTPALLARQGAATPHPRYLFGRANSVIRRNAHRDEFVRAVRGDDHTDAIWLEPIHGQESHMIARAAAADALVHVPRGEGEIAAGDVVRFLALD